MRLIHACYADIANGHVVGQYMGFNRGWIAIASIENIAKTAVQMTERFTSCVSGHRTAMVVKYLPDIVDAMTMIGMIMRPEHGIEINDVGRQQLRPQIRRCIDQDPGGCSFHDDGRPAPPVSGLGGVAGTPIIADAWNA
jgi:hypothetical protein